MSLLAFKNSVKSRDGIIHLNNAGMTPLRPAARLAADQVQADQVRYGAARIFETFMNYEKCKVDLATFLNIENKDLAWVPNVATAMSQVAFGIDFGSKDEIIVIDQEYPSSIYAWMAVAKQKNLKLTTLTSQSDYSFDFDKLLGSISSQTRVVSLSWVQYQTGTTAPLSEIAQACHRVGAWLVVDAIQGLGVIPFDFAKSGVDIVCGGGHKWLCGPAGLGFLGVRPEIVEDIAPIIHGASTYGQIGDPINQSLTPHKTAARFETGCPQTANAAAFAAAVRELGEIGLGAIHKEAVRLADSLTEKLFEAGFEVLRKPGAISPITTFRTTAKTRDLETLKKILHSKQVSFVERAEGIRLAPHAFNTDEDILQTMSYLQT